MQAVRYYLRAGSSSLARSSGGSCRIKAAERSGAPEGRGLDRDDRLERAAKDENGWEPTGGEVDLSKQDTLNVEWAILIVAQHYGM